MMIEKLARAISAENGDEYPLEHYIPDARAALTALLEPSEAMTVAGDDVEMYGVSVLGIGESHTVFCTMIQAALDEKEG